MKYLNLPHKGSITVEYMIVLLLLMIPLWYAMLGGSGSWSNAPNISPNKGNLTRTANTPANFPGLVKTLDDREYKFADEINQP